YLLAKELAYDVVTGQTDNLAAALAKTSGKDIVQFAKALGIAHSKIDDRICVVKPGTTTSNLGKYAVITEGDTNDARISLCGGKAAGDGSVSRNTVQNVFRDFVRETLKDGNHNWPTSTRKAGKSAGPTPVTNDNATAVATDLTKLTSDEKTIVAGLLAKTIERGEVVEIRAVSSTSVMVNSSGYTKLRHMM
ncbi:P44-new outer membrane protein, partial [Anaplasma phagocytophilum str. CRT38]